tara:strand:+ start:329 stop:562 length:234 start_codon:yes stop_codon:yes gene_type:complete
MRRLEGFTITMEAIARIASEYGYAPQDAKYVRSFFMGDRDSIVLVMESPDFAEVPEGSAIPIDALPQHSNAASESHC